MFLPLTLALVVHRHPAVQRMLQRCLVHLEESTQLCLNDYEDWKLSFSRCRLVVLESIITYHPSTVNKHKTNCNSLTIAESQ